jgi:hypothetical protein
MVIEMVTTPTTGGQPIQIINNVNLKYEYDPDDPESVSFWSRCKNNLNKTFAFFINTILPLVTLSFLSSSMQFLIDTGAQVNVMDEHTYKSLRNKPPLSRARVKLHTYDQGNEIPVLGSFHTRLKCDKGYLKRVEFIVVKGFGGNLLSYSTSVDLGIIDPIKQIHQIAKKIDDAIVSEYKRKYPLLFDNRVGLFTDFDVKLNINYSQEPKQQRLRPIPGHLRPLVEEQIRQMKEKGLIEESRGATWVSPIVPVMKDDGSLRICLDARAANKAITRQRHSCPTMDDLKFALARAKVFSKIDLKSGYNQLQLDPESRHITSFATHLGIFQYTRLVFGLNTAGEIFQKVIYDVIKDIPNVINISDDIIIFTETEEEHKRSLDMLLERLQSKGFTVNGDKCEFMRPSLKFFGFNFSAEGISLDHKKYDAIQKATPPKTASELRSLLGLASYCSEFIPRMSSITLPLRELLKKREFKWTTTHDNALNQLKQAIYTQNNSYFDKNLKTEIVVDASPCGLGAVMLHYDPNTPKNKKVVMYISRALSKTEAKYDQMEREGLAVVWAIERLHYYLYGIEFTVITDNSAVMNILHNAQSKPKARIERWFLRLLPYQFNIIQKKGEENIADYLSRNPVEPPTNRYENFCERLIANVTTGQTAISHKVLVEETSKDPTLKQVKSMISDNSFKVDGEAKKYLDFKKELTVTSDGIVLRNLKIILPESLQKHALEIAHSGHMGMSKTKALLRSYVWFPKIDSMVENLINNCNHCKLNVKKTHKAPYGQNSFPEYPWEEVDIDFYDYMWQGKHLLVVMDPHSNYPIVEILSSTAADSTISVLNKAFCMFGRPTTLKSDNGPPFNSFKFSEFCKNNDIYHHRTTPYWPRGNAVAERFMKSIRKLLANSKPQNVQERLNEFLRNYRDTPHSTTGKTPNELMFAYQAQTSRLPRIHNNNAFKNDGAALKQFVQEKRMRHNFKEDKRLHNKPHKFEINDLVNLINRNRPKIDTIFDKNGPFKVIGIKHSQLTIERNGKRKIVNASEVQLDSKPPKTVSNESNTNKNSNKNRKKNTILDDEPFFYYENRAQTESNSRKTNTNPPNTTRNNNIKQPEQVNDANRPIIIEHKNSKQDLRNLKEKNHHQQEQQNENFEQHLNLDPHTNSIIPVENDQSQAETEPNQANNDSAEANEDFEVENDQGETEIQPNQAQELQVENHNVDLNSNAAQNDESNHTIINESVNNNEESSNNNSNLDEEEVENDDSNSANQSGKQENNSILNSTAASNDNFHLNMSTNDATKYESFSQPNLSQENDDSEGERTQTESDNEKSISGENKETNSNEEN